MSRLAREIGALGRFGLRNGQRDRIASAFGIDTDRTPCPRSPSAFLFETRSATRPGCWVLTIDALLLRELPWSSSTPRILMWISGQPEKIRLYALASRICLGHSPERARGDSRTS